MHSALRPKPAVKIPSSLIPPSVSYLKKPSINQNEHHEKSTINGKQYNSKVALNENNNHHHHDHDHIKSNNLTTEKCTWSLGLINSKGKYLTAETFGFKINATGVCLKKKQTWTIIFNSQNDCVYLQSALNNYLSTDKYGRLKCDGHDMVDDCRFQLEYNQKGQWAFKSLTYGMYLGGDVDQLHCFSKAPEWWSPHLALHPQINLKHVLRKRYAKINNDEIHIDNIIPWGSEAILTVEYFDGQYCVRSCNGLYFHKDGKLIAKKTNDTFFTIELFKGYLTFKDCDHCYLTAIGPLGIMTTRNKIAGRDEQFLLEESKQQICLIAPNGKLVSTKQGVDLSANQCEKDNSSTFQLEYDDHLELYHIRTYNNKYWKLEGNGVQATADKRSIETGFYIQATDNGRVTFQASNGKYIIPHATGHMRAIGDQSNSIETLFLLKFVNRPFGVFKCEFGYVAYRNKQSRTLECNKSIFTLFTLEQPNDDSNNDGIICLKGVDGMYWEISSDSNISVSGREPSKFAIELCTSHSRIVLKGPNGMYLRAEQNGSIQASCQNSRQATQWEF
ncbi:unnamed protein product [Rotaria magnacalcarata]|uniref:Fascin-like domain-containing protein n=1 Tax=Rotaria magnacalcarata TaxID=392030 RepID=A0A815QIU0_9BILA|nr:unnamed protein product [Rotaria magnacalcarata]CAF1519175.1 unnamed protein product [Rotaria magnacalcarata]CAF1923120.1 unnamed protein product [Rotaria magnacalcarata]CAF2119121.1 unnamed protein product [Rotaria magnacalcarata]CAF3735353.1 unnamed protein product [Rotaria magnacalcarata]